MRIEVIGRDFLITDAIREHAESKVSKLPRFFDGVQQINVTISRLGHSNHATYDVEIIVDVEKHEDFVSHGKGDDLYATIDQAVQKASRQLTDFKERLKTEKR